MPKYSYKTQSLLHPERLSNAKGLKRPKARLNHRIPDEHSALVPPLPIPNRAVKRCCAYDSMDYPCESRSSSGPYKAQRPSRLAGEGRCALWCSADPLSGRKQAVARARKKRVSLHRTVTNGAIPVAPLVSVKTNLAQPGYVGTNDLLPASRTILK